MTVTLKAGPPVTGRFVDADPSVVRLEVAGNILKINFDDIVSLVFAPDLSPKTTTAAATSAVPQESGPPGAESATAALRALRKLAGATDIGINFQEYGSRLIDTKNEVDEALGRLPEGELRNELALALEAYVDAGQAWNRMLRHDFMLHTYEPGSTLMRKYSLQPMELVPGNKSTLALPRNYVLSKLWGAARARIDRASTILSQGGGHSPAGAGSPPSGSDPTSTPARASAQGEEAVGTWSITLEIAGKSTQGSFIISKASEGYIGQISSPDGVTPINGLNVEGGDVSATFQDVVDNQRVTVNLTAKVSGDVMTGQMRVTAQNGQWVIVPLTGRRGR